MLTSHHRNKSLRRAEDLNFYDIFIIFVKERILFFSHRIEYKTTKECGNRQILATKIDREHPHLPHYKPELHTFDQNHEVLLEVEGFVGRCHVIII